jgi:hypothetical protein
MAHMKSMFAMVLDAGVTMGAPVRVGAAETKLELASTFVSTFIVSRLLKSKTADVWVDRRSNFTKSMAVMSMVGFPSGVLLVHGACMI